MVGARRNGTNRGRKRESSHAKKRKKRTKYDIIHIFISCEGLSLDRGWQFPTDSQETTIFTFHTLFSFFTQRKRRCCYNIITAISHVISSEGIHRTEKN